MKKNHHHLYNFKKKVSVLDEIHKHQEKRE
jgi:hypothetical protein